MWHQSCKAEMEISISVSQNCSMNSGKPPSQPQLQFVHYLTRGTSTPQSTAQCQSVALWPLGPAAPALGLRTEAGVLVALSPSLKWQVKPSAGLLLHNSSCLWDKLCRRWPVLSCTCTVHSRVSARVPARPWEVFPTDPFHNPHNPH